MKKQILNFLLISISISLVSCDMTGVDGENGEVDNDLIVENTPDESDSVEVIGDHEFINDTINGIPNDMVYQRDDGLRIEWTKKNPDKPIELNDVVMVNYEARVGGGEIYDSNKEVGDPVPIKSNIGMMIKGWEEGLLLMNVGDKGRIMIPYTLGYGENGYSTIVPPYADIIVEIEIVSRIEPIVLEEGVKVYKWKSVSEGAKPVKNQFITFDYFAYKKGEKGGMYDNSYQNQAPFQFKFKNANVIDGLHQGMSVMKAGESAFIEIPSKLAYGSKGLLDLVPSNTDVVYDVRVEKIE